MFKFICRMISIMLLLTTAAQSSEDQQETALTRIVKAYRAKLPKLSLNKGEENTEVKARSIVHLLGQFRPPSSRSPNIQLGGEERLILKVKRLIEQDLTLRFILPSFPFKSKNTEKKVLGSDPDLGELIGLITLDHVCQEISRVHSKGAYVTLVNDGVYCAEALGLPELVSTEYEDQIKMMIKSLEVGKSVEILSLAELPDPRVYGKSFKEIIEILDGFKLEKGRDYKPEILFNFSRKEVACDFYRSQAKPVTLEASKLLKPYKNLPAEIREAINGLTFDEVLSYLEQNTSEDIKLKLNTFKNNLNANYNHQVKVYCKSLADRICEVISLRNKQFSYLLSELIDNDQIIRLSNFPRQEDVSIKLPFSLIYNHDDIPGTPWHHTPVVQESDLYGIEISMQERPNLLLPHEELMPGLAFPIRFISKINL